MGKLVRKSTDKVEETNSNPDGEKKSRIRKILARKEKAKSAENTMLNSPPLSMSGTMQFINEHNEKAKLSPNFGKISENKLDVDNLSDHDMFKNFFQR